MADRKPVMYKDVAKKIDTGKELGELFIKIYENHNGQVTEVKTIIYLFISLPTIL